MNFCKRKLLAYLLAAAMLVSIIPATVFAADEAVVITSEQELKEAVAAIPEEGSGEITIQNIIMFLTEGLYIEKKDVTFHLINAQLVTAADENGYGQPVIFGFGANITINADDNSTMQTTGHTGNMGVVRIDNSTDWDAETETFAETFTLTVNGGRYVCTDALPNEDDEADSVFVAASGTKVALSNVVCNGTVKAIAFEGVGITVPGELTVNSGKFANDVSGYAANGTYACQYGESYYVREKEMTDAFSKPLTEGKVVFQYAKPTTDEEAVWLIAEDFCMANPDFYFDPEGFSSDFSQLELGIHYGTAKEEFHMIDVVWDYDADVLQAAQAFIEKFPDEDRPWFHVSDLELVNYWVYHNPDSEIDSLANYSGELKSILGNNNFLYTIEVRGGADDVFYTERIGSAKLMHDGKVYFATTMIGARAEHAIYVPESTADTKEALIAAAQKRIDDYIGENVIRITAADETVTEYYNNTLADYDSQLTQAQEVFDREAAKPEAERDWSAYWDAKSTLEYTPGDKQYFMDSFLAGGDLHFLKNAAGDFFFHVEIVGTEDIYKFVIIKDDNLLAVPSYATVDLNTNVSVTTGSVEVPLDTLIEVSKLTEGADYDRIIEILDVETNETFDIKLYSGSLAQYVTKLEDDKFEVRIPIPEKLQGKENLIVYYVNQNNQPVDYAVELKEDGKVAVFVTDHFSIYTLAEEASQTEEHTQHTEVDLPAKEATCTETGLTAGKKCSVCGTVTVEQTVVAAKGHTLKKIAANAATYFASGNIEHYTCSVCGALFADAEGAKEVTVADITLAQLVKIEDTTADISTDVVENVIQDAVNNGTANIVITVTKDKLAEDNEEDSTDTPETETAPVVTKTQLPLTAVEQVAYLHAEATLTIHMTDATVTLNKATLDAVIETAKTENTEAIALEILQIETEALTADQQAAVEEKTVAAVISASILVNNKEVHDFNGGQVTVAIPFTPEAGTTASDYIVLYVADDGTVEQVPSTFTDGKLVLTLSHFSEYVVVNTTAPKDPTNPGTGDLLNPAVAIMLMAVSAAGIVVLSGKKRL